MQEGVKEDNGLVVPSAGVSASASKNATAMVHSYVVRPGGGLGLATLVELPEPLGTLLDGDVSCIGRADAARKAGHFELAGVGRRLLGTGWRPHMPVKEDGAADSNEL